MEEEETDVVGVGVAGAQTVAGNINPGAAATPSLEPQTTGSAQVCEGLGVCMRYVPL